MSILEQKINKYKEFVVAIDKIKQTMFPVKSLLPPTMQRELRMYNEFISDLEEIQSTIQPPAFAPDYPPLPV